MILNVFTDGGSRGNPGPAAVGIVVKNSANQTLRSFGQTIGTATNNIAEYQAVITALEWLKDNQSQLSGSAARPRINFFLDSVLIVNQLNGLWKVKNDNLRQKVILIRELEAGLNASINYTAIPRTQNSAADFQVNLALDQ